MSALSELINQDFRVLNHDRCVVTGFDQSRVALDPARKPGGGGLLHDATVCCMNGRKKRGAPISYRPPTGLSAEFRSRVQNSGLSINAFITQAVFGQTAPRVRRAAPLDQKIAAQLLSQSARIADRLEAVGQSGQHSAIDECRNELIEIRSCLMAALGRSP